MTKNKPTLINDNKIKIQLIGFGLIMTWLIIVAVFHLPRVLVDEFGINSSEIGYLGYVSIFAIFLTPILIIAMYIARSLGREIKNKNKILWSVSTVLSIVLVSGLLLYFLIWLVQ